MTEQQPGPPKQVTIERLYLKEFSFDSPRAPEVFTGNLNPEKLLNIQSTHSAIDPERVEVTLTLAVKTIVHQETLYQVQVIQAGVFRITGYTPAERVEIVGRVCPETLFPFARKIIAGAVRKGGFPEILLRPLDFDALFAQNMRERAGQVSAAS
jgi:preprotein translocase subunit SecB